jgi:two-component system, sensor histidine kinase SagS
MMRGRRILLADDEEDLRSTLADLLRDLGAEVTEADSGHEALEHMAQEEPFDLVVTDVVMGAPYGTQLAAMARTAEYHAPILVITGHRDPAIAEALQKLEHAELLLKPFDAESFLQQVEELIGVRQGVEE